MPSIKERLDVYRVTEQVHYRTRKLEKLKHRKSGEFREVPLPQSIRETIERFVEKNGTTEDGYVLQGTRAKHMNHSTSNAIWYRKLAGKSVDITKGMTSYGTGTSSRRIACPTTSPSRT